MDSELQNLAVALRHLRRCLQDFQVSNTNQGTIAAPFLGEASAQERRAPSSCTELHKGNGSGGFPVLSSSRAGPSQPPARRGGGSSVRVPCIEQEPWQQDRSEPEPDLPPPLPQRYLKPQP